MSEQLTKDSFEKVWLKLVGDDMGFMAAYREAEKQHMIVFGSHRYSGYKSFAASRDYKKK